MSKKEDYGIKPLIDRYNFFAYTLIFKKNKFYVFIFIIKIDDFYLN